MITPKQLFDTGLQYHHYANTAYPLTPGSFRSFRINEQEKHLDFLKSEWAKAKEFSIYVHIPFCKTRCKFCEYVVLENSDTSYEDEYIELLLKEIEMYKSIIGQKPVAGFDIGGGTPTKLSIQNLQIITNAIRDSFNFKNDVEFSIETTPIIAANEP